MIPDAATTTSSTPAPQAAAPVNPASSVSPAASAGAAPGPQPTSASPAPQPTPVQLLWEVAYLAFGLMTRLVHVLRPIQQYYPKPALLLARLLIDIPRILLTIRYAPERVTMAQLRHLTRARHILQALFNYTLPLGPRTPSSATTTAYQSPSASTQNATPLGPRTSPSATAYQSPSASTENASPLGARTPSSATTPSPAVSAAPSPNAPSSTTPGVRTPTIRQVPEIPMVAGVSHVPASPTVDNSQFPPDPSHTSPTSHPSHSSHSAIPNPQSATSHSAFRIQHSDFSPFVPDVHTLLQALKADSLPPNCAGALFEEPGEALVKALHQLHAIYFSLYPNQPPSPPPSPSNGNPQSSICNLQSGNPQSDAPSVHNVQSVQSIHSPSPAQSEISNLKSEIPNPDSSIPHSPAPP